MQKFSDGTILDSMNAQAYNHLFAGGNKYLNMEGHWWLTLRWLIESNYYHRSASEYPFFIYSSVERYSQFLYAEHITIEYLIYSEIIPKGMASVLLNWHWQDLSREGHKSVPKLQSKDRSKLSLGTSKCLATMIDTGQKIYVDKNLHT